MSNRKRNVVALLAGIVVGALMPIAVVPTVAAWVDLGGAEVLLTAVDQPVAPTPTAPIEPLAPDTSFGSAGTWDLISPVQFCFNVSVFTTSPTPAQWTVVLHTARPPFNQLGPPFSGFQGQLYPTNYVFTPAADYATSGDILMTPEASYEYASATVPWPLQVCAANVPFPAWQPAGPDTYEVISTTLVRNGDQPCVAVLVRGYTPYFIGFTATFNWQTVLLAQATPAEQAAWLPLKHWAGSAPGYPFGSSGSTAADYSVTLTAYDPNHAAIAENADITLSSCAYNQLD